MTRYIQLHCPTCNRIRLFDWFQALYTGGRIFLTCTSCTRPMPVGVYVSDTTDDHAIKSAGSGSPGESPNRSS